jgi:hypothetical protein
VFFWDLLAPANKIGYVQGLNNAAMNFGMALAPWLCGVLADNTTTDTAIWTGVIISVVAALTNTPLMFHKGFGPAEKKPPPSKRPLPGEDLDLVEKALAGEFVSPDELWLINRARMKNHQPAIVARVQPYEDKKDDLGALLSHADEAFQARANLQNRILAEIANPAREMELQELCDMVNDTKKRDPEMINETNSDLGQWVADYLADNGYNPHLNSVVMKQMVLSAFPSIPREKEYTPDNIKDALLLSNQVMHEYLAHQKKKKYSWSKMLDNGGVQGRFYS